MLLPAVLHVQIIFKGIFYIITIVLTVFCLCPAVLGCKIARTWITKTVSSQGCKEINKSDVNRSFYLLLMQHKVINKWNSFGQVGSNPTIIKVNIWKWMSNKLILFWSYFMISILFGPESCANVGPILTCSFWSRALYFEFPDPLLIKFPDFLSV